MHRTTNQQSNLLMLGDTMQTYFVDYTYNTTGTSFQAKYAFVRILATSKADAISKARKQAPRNAKGFRATLQ